MISLLQAAVAAALVGVVVFGDDSWCKWGGSCTLDGSVCMCFPNLPPSEKKYPRYASLVMQGSCSQQGAGGWETPGRVFLDTPLGFITVSVCVLSPGFGLAWLK
jgi:hypothetical protein